MVDTVTTNYLDDIPLFKSIQKRCLLAYRYISGLAIVMITNLMGIDP